MPVSMNLVIAYLLAGSLPGVSAETLANTFQYVCPPSSQTDCAGLVKTQLINSGIASTDIVIRTNYNAGAAGNHCSFEIKSTSALSKSHVLEILNQKGKLSTVQLVDRPRPVDRHDSDRRFKKKNDPFNLDILSLTGADLAASQLGLTGKGVRVAILDTGVYYLHPALGGCFGFGCKVAYGYDLVGDDGVSPDSDPLDNCSALAHGTHVAGIIAGDTRKIPKTNSSWAPVQNFTGAAPGATLGAYRVFSCSGQSSTDIIAQAIYMAAADNSSIINLSLGGGPGFDSGDAASVAVNYVSANGILVVIANGNDGDAGAFSAGTPAISRGVFGVAAFNSKYGGLQGKFQIGSSPPFLGTLGHQSPPFSAAINLNAIVANNTSATADDGDGLFSINPGCFGKPCLIRWDSLGDDVTRCNNAFLAGATACILYDYQKGPLLYIYGSSVLPSAFISNQNGLAILNALKINKKPSFKLISVDSEYLSTFSSRGLESELFIKPNLGAIGGNVYSTISAYAAAIFNGGDPYTRYSGTSMATPNLAGSLALMVEYMKKNNRPTSFSSINTLLYNSAKPKTDFGSGLLDSVINQGSGLHNVYNALSLKTQVTPAQLLHDYCHQHESRQKSYLVSSRGAAMVTPFAKGDDAIQTMRNEGFTATYATLAFSTTSFSLKPQESKNITVTFTAPTGAGVDPTLFPMYSGYIVVDAIGCADQVYVPYAGMIGDWKSAPVWSRKSASLEEIPLVFTMGPAYHWFPRLSIIITYTGNDNTVLNQLVASGVSTTAMYAVMYKPYGIKMYRRREVGPRNIPFNTNFVQRLQPPYAYPWDGLVLSESRLEFVPLPQGTYQAQFVALRNFGNPALYPQDYDIVAVNFTLVY